MIEKRDSAVYGYAEKLKENATKHELQLKKCLDEIGIEYEFQKPIIDNKSYILDFYMETVDGKKFAIELDGTHHNRKKLKRYDKKRSEYLLKTHQIHVFRFNNHNNKKELDYIVARIVSTKPKLKPCFMMDELDIA